MARKPEVVEKQVEKMQELIEDARLVINDPDATDEEKAEAEEDIKDFQKKIDRLTGGAPTVQPV
jgi:soluble cytochrome b562